jgi:LPS sulfotransferase NodH
MLSIASAFSQSAVSVDGLRQILGDRRAYVICTIPRSGSTWLTELAAQTGRLGLPQEWFNPGFLHGIEQHLGCLPPRLLGVDDINEYIRIICTRYCSSDGTMGIEFNADHLREFLQLLDQPLRLQRPLQFFFLRRRDLVPQAISFYRSLESGLFHSYQEAPSLREKFDAVSYSPDRILALMRHLADHEIYFERLFADCQVDPCRLFYEDLARDPGQVLRCVMKRVALGTDPGHFSPNEGTVQRRSDHISKLWGIKLREEKPEEIRQIENGRPALVNSL